MVETITKERKEKILKLLEFLGNIEDFNVYIEEIFEGDNMSDWRDSVKVAERLISSVEEK